MEELLMFQLKIVIIFMKSTVNVLFENYDYFHEKNCYCYVLCKIKNVPPYQKYNNFKAIVLLLINLYPKIKFNQFLIQLNELRTMKAFVMR